MSPERIAAITGVVVVVVVIAILLVTALQQQGQKTDLCGSAGFEGFHSDPTGDYCFKWRDGQKVLTPLGDVGR